MSGQPTVIHRNVCFLFHLNNFSLEHSNVACGWRSIFISRKSKICHVRYLLQLLSAVVCAADGRRVVWAVSRRPSRGVSGSFDDRCPSSLRTTIVVPTKIALCVPSLRVGAGRDFYFLVILRVFLIKYVNIPCIHTKTSFYRNLIVISQNQQFGASPTSIFPHKQCKVLFGFSRLSQHWIFSVHATLGTLFQKNYIS